MGKWMLEYHDDVLGDKFKSMVNAAIKRLNLEKGEPASTYEAFVTDLDTGDSFTSSLVDIMVKELADRRTRPNPLDRRMISENTAKSLRMYGERTRIYRERPSSSFGLSLRPPTTVYPFPPPDIDQLEEEEDAGDSNETYNIGGVPAVNDAFRREPWSYTETEPLLSPPSSEGHALERVTSPLPVSPPSRPWVPSALLHRQNSIRRPSRSRTLDFSEFSTRRRGQHRANTQAAAAGDALRSEESTDGTWRFHSRLSAGPSTSTGSSNRLHFLPMAALVAPQYQADADSSNSSSEQRTPFPHNHFSHHYPSPPPLPSASSSQSSISSVPPRLRRGGLRAPESLLQQQGRPESITPSSAEITTLAGNPPRERTSLEPPSVALRNAIERFEASGAEEGATQLLTPRSVSPAEDSSV
ncbi:hypothetical protein BDY19DRAFT_925657 [Irpex rosettiformis]|uniref:Uncharacterized protein n=1 Tax=Irpex rosettiformis TaxID=378272 RepID=A0ACB8UEE6_9APHY|nr:hypothetical protein BDY19DRAFT_925657 [Irpex rosettiformis]